MKTLGVGEIKAHFSDILEQVKGGEKIAIGYGKKKIKVAMIVPCESETINVDEHTVSTRSVLMRSWGLKLSGDDGSPPYSQVRALLMKEKWHGRQETFII